MAIPRRIIQTHRSEDILREARETWRTHHPDYEYLFFTDAQCRAFMAERFAPLLPAYDALPLAVQKADMFRYAAVFELGGFYADVDTLCCEPLHQYIDLDKAEMVVGLEMMPNQFGGGIKNYLANYCAPYQMLQWTFGASQGHPALGIMLERIRYLCSHLSAQEMSSYSAHDGFTLQMTGPVLFTQVLTDFLSGTRPGAVSVLPRLAWGAWPAEQQKPELMSQVKVRHMFLGTWKAEVVAANAARPPAAAQVNYSIRY